jgi:hypothetical protein
METFINVFSIVTCVSSVALAHTNQFHEVHFIIGTYLLVDLLCLKKEADMLAHHLLTLLLLVNTYSLDFLKYRQETLALTNVEISSFFLTMSHLFKDNVIVVPAAVKTANKVLFVVTFVKYRIWDYYWFLLRSDKTDIPLVVVVSIYGLGALNAYWLVLIAARLKTQLLTVKREVRPNRVQRV